MTLIPNNLSMLPCRLKDGKITAGEYKFIAKEATHQLYKSALSIGSEEWQRKQIELARSMSRKYRTQKHN